MAKSQFSSAQQSSIQLSLILRSDDNDLLSTRTYRNIRAPFLNSFTLTNCSDLISYLLTHIDLSDKSC